MKTIIILSMLWLGINIAIAQQTSVSVVALSVPEKSNGLVHLRTGENESKPLQLSKTSFSVPTSLTLENLELFSKPFKAGEEAKPLLSIKLPKDKRNHKVLVWYSEEKWRGHAFASDNWPDACIVLLNLTEKSILLESGKTNKTIAPKRAVLLKGEIQQQSSPVKLYFLDKEDPESKTLVFSSAWSLPSGGQEIIVLNTGRTDKTIKLHSFVYQATKPATKKE